MAVTFVNSKYGGMVPSDHPDADPNSGPVDPSQTTSAGQTTPATGGATPAPPPPGAGAPAQPAAQAPAPASTTPAAPGTPTTVQDAYRNTLLGLLNGPTPEQAASDVNNSAPVAAFRNEQMRQLGMNQAGAAEESGINGTQGSGGFDARVAGLGQAASENTANYAGSQASAAQAARAQQLQQALTMAESSGQFDQAQALQLQLAQMSNATQNRSIDVQQSLGNQSNANQAQSIEVQKMLGMSDQDLRKYLGDKQIDLSKYGIDVGAGTAADQLGLGYDQLNEQGYRDWLAAQQQNGGGV